MFWFLAVFIVVMAVMALYVCFTVHESSSIQSTEYGTLPFFRIPTQLALILDSFYSSLLFMDNPTRNIRMSVCGIRSGIPGMDDFNSCDTTFPLDI